MSFYEYLHILKLRKANTESFLQQKYFVVTPLLIFISELRKKMYKILNNGKNYI